MILLQASRASLFVLLVSATAAPVRAQIPLLNGRSATVRYHGAGNSRNAATITFSSAPSIPIPYTLNPVCNATQTTAIRVGTAANPGPLITLPCAHWTWVRSGLRYRDPTGSAGGVTSVQFSPSHLKIKLKGSNAALFPGPVGALDVTFAIGNVAFCGRFQIFRRNNPDWIAGTWPSTSCAAAPTATTAVSTPTRTTAIATPTDTLSPTTTPTALPSATSSVPAAASATATWTFTPMQTATPTPQLPSPTATHVPSATTAPTLTATATNAPTGTPTRTRSATPVPSSTATATRTATPGPVCGDGVRQGNEQCDDGNTDNGDCCSATCTFEPAGNPCTGDGNVCTNDLCDAAGTCTHQPNTAACDDANACTSGDTCSGGVCHGTGVKPWINELSYDSYTFGDITAQWDREEFVEIAAPAGTDLSSYRLFSIEGGGPLCGTGSASVGNANYQGTLPAGTVIPESGTGVGFLVVCFRDTSDVIDSAGKCNVTLPTSLPFTLRSALQNGDTLNLTNNCPDGVLLLDASGGLVDAVSYEGQVPASGTYGGFFVDAPNAGTDPGDSLQPRQSLAKNNSTLRRATAASEWQLTAANGDTPGQQNATQALTCTPDATECGNGIVEFGEDCERDAHCGSGWQCVGCWCEPAQGATYTRTRYPIVLAHGFLGFDSLLGVLDYWWGIKSALESGGAQVFVSAVSQVNSPQVRGEQLIAQIEQIVATTGKPKVNLIGHSQGGLDIRYVAAVRPDLVASVTSVAGPHQGSEIADVLGNSFINGAFTQDIVAYFGNALGDVLALLSGSSYPNDAVAALHWFSSQGAATFNAAYPQGLPTTPCGDGPSVVNGIRYYSWSGTGTVTTGTDPTDKYLALTSVFFSEANDGLVGRCSSHLGKVLRDNYFHNHLDEVNQAFGDVPFLETNPRKIFRDHTNRLKNAGL